MPAVRPPAVAGFFYPGSRSELEPMVTGFLDEAGSRLPGGVLDEPAPKVLIAPHAGYRYSGSTAALAYRRLREVREQITRVVLLGPVHRVPVRGLAIDGADAFATPLGEIPCDREAENLALELPQVVRSRAAHAEEHSLEVHLPFLQATIARFSLVALAVGGVGPEPVAEVIDALWGGPETLIVISTDLSHYHPYDEARRIDAATMEQILPCDARIEPEQACGSRPVNGILTSLPRHGLAPRLLGMCSSGDTAGDKRRVVGYASLDSVAEARHD